MRIKKILVIMSLVGCTSNNKLKSIEGFLNMTFLENTIEISSTNSSFTGEGYDYKVLKFSKNDFEKVLSQSNNENFKDITVDNLIKEGFLNDKGREKILIPNTDLKTLQGVYKLKSYSLQDLEFEVAFLDKINHEIIYYKSF